MRDALVKAVGRLCSLFPGLKSDINYSEVLTAKDIDVFSFFVGGCVSVIKSEDVKLVQSLLISSLSGDSSHLYRDYVSVLRSDPSAYSRLSSVCDKIVKNNLFGSCPLVFSDSWTARIPLIRKLHEFDDFHRAFHQSVHFVLEKSGLHSGDSDFDEALVVFLHESVFGNKARLHYFGKEGSRYLSLADSLKDSLKHLKQEEIIPHLKAFLVENSVNP